MHRPTHATVLLAALLLALQTAWAWTPALPPATLAALSPAERTDWLAADALFAKRQFPAATTAFETFATTYPDSPALAAATFMRAHSLLHDDRALASVRVYQQVVDFFPGDLYYAPAAMYYIAEAYTTIFDPRKGMLQLTGLVKTPAYASHPLVADAYAKLAINARQNDDEATYIRYATLVHRDFWTINRQRAESMRHELTRHYLVGQHFAEIEELNAIHAYKNPTADAAFHYYVWDRAYYDVFPGRPLYETTDEIARQDDIDGFWAYWTDSRPVIVAASQWEWDWRSLTFLLRYRPDREELWRPILDGIIAGTATDDQRRTVISHLTVLALHDEAQALIPGIRDKQAFFPGYAQQLLNKSYLDEADPIIAQIEDEKLRNWLVADALRRRSKWHECIAVLQTIIATDPGRAQAARWLLADIYMHHTRAYQLAVDTYIAIDEPPQSLFLLAQAYEYLKEYQKAADTYRLIEKNHPEHGAEALKREAEMWARIGMKDKSIACARRLMKDYKGSSQASWVHASSHLDNATGGGELSHE